MDLRDFLHLVAERVSLGGGDTIAESELRVQAHEAIDQHFGPASDQAATSSDTTAAGSSDGTQATVNDGTQTASTSGEQQGDGQHV